MYRADKLTTSNKQEFYRQLVQLLDSLTNGETNPVANLANAAGLLYHQLDSVNWAGFYLLEGNQLVLGPFQGKPACTRIPLGKGVCGTAAAKASTLWVPDVCQFPGHIACDEASRSELVIPLKVAGRLIGVMDIDSPVACRFDRQDINGLEQFARHLGRALEGNRAAPD